MTTHGSTADGGQGRVMTVLITLLLPYFNEDCFLGDTLASLSRQTDRRFKLVLVDNGSTDGSNAIAREADNALPDIAVVHVHMPQPGKIHALLAGLEYVDTRYLATCDADTIYPPDYVAKCLTLFQCPNDPPAGVMAIDLYAHPTSTSSTKRIAKIMKKSRRFSSKCHAGAYAQAFEMQALHRAGGLINPSWSYALEDHEVINRLHRVGRTVYSPDHYCFPAARRKDCSNVSWTPFERLIYRFTPKMFNDWLFYRFLANRFQDRRLFNINLRNRDWS